MEVRQGVSRSESCFYGGAFPQLRDKHAVVRGLSPKAVCEEKARGFRCVSFDCDSLSEKLQGKKESRGCGKVKVLSRLPAKEEFLAERRVVRESLDATCWLGAS